MRKVQLVYQDKTYQEAHTQTYGNRDLRLMMKIYVHKISAFCTKQAMPAWLEE